MNLAGLESAVHGADHTNHHHCHHQGRRRQHELSAWNARGTGVVAVHLKVVAGDGSGAAMYLQLDP